MPSTRDRDDGGETDLRPRRVSSNTIPPMNRPEDRLAPRTGIHNDRNKFAPMSPEPPRVYKDTRHELLDLQKTREEAIERQQESGNENSTTGEAGPLLGEGVIPVYDYDISHIRSIPESSGSFSQRNERPSALDSDDPPDNSPYSQVRAAVSAGDNISLSINTPRMWTLSFLFAVLGSATNLFFSLRYPSVTITPVIALLLVHPLGLLWDGVFKRSDDPEESFIDGTLQKLQTPLHPNDPSRPLRGTCNAYPRRTELPAGFWGRSRCWLAQGRWNEKEHACVYISSNVSFGFAFATDVSIRQSLQSLVV